MAYRPLHAQRFGPSTRACAWAYAYCLAAAAAVAVVFAGYNAPRGSWLFHLIVDHANPSMPLQWFVLAVLASGLAAVFQAHMRGVVLHPDGIETFEFAAFGLPRVRRFDWPVIDRFRFDTKSTIALDLWDGSHALLPEVGDRDGLTRALAYVAMARAIPYTGDPGVEFCDD
jgi:hypothetical protein